MGLAVGHKLPNVVAPCSSYVPGKQVEALEKASDLRFLWWAILGLNQVV